MAQLALVRHGESEWNAKNLWTGWTDIVLSEKGHLQAKEAGEKLKGTVWDFIYESDLIRAKQTSDEILLVIGQNPQRITAWELKERNYGIYTGKNKLDIEKEVGEEEYLRIRRGWDVPIPEGESLKQVYERVAPYFKSEIEPKLDAGKNIIISAHGNSLRALIKYLYYVSDEEIEKLEIAVGEVKINSFLTR